MFYFYGDKMNINTQEYWDEIWSREGLKTWRIYPKTHELISDIVGYDKNVLELGCGVGILMKKLKDKNNLMTGIDISESAINEVRKQGMNGIAMKLPGIPFQFSFSHFNYCVACEFIEHFEDPSIMLMEMSSYAKKSIIVVPDNCLPNIICPEHHRTFTKESLQKELEKYWFSVLVHQYIDEFEKGTTKIKLPCLLAICKDSKFKDVIL
jgi:2-polyprenyl-3-methyl-5-hydroxy-6-metoxy-1,4-benzoquinol methylase